MSNLLEILSRWRGRRYVSDALRCRGFLIPQSYEAVIKEQCATDDRASVDIYWEEIAREFVTSAGVTNSVSRYISERGGYKSGYLDDLYVLEASRGSKNLTNSLHPCDRKFLQRKYEDRLFSLEIADQMEALKMAEIECHNIDASMWNGTKAGSRNCFRELLTKSGYRINGKIFYEIIFIRLDFHR
ncbi:MAG: hypothetical protein WDN69_22830 [Aliidongia sp.]